MRARIAANARWSREDPSKQRDILRAARRSKFEREVDPDGILPPAERARRVRNAERAHMQRMALASSKAAAARRTGEAAGGAA
jgi:hypothetical protein